MGGLLSAHMFAADLVGRWGFGLSWYKDELLHLAHDLGKRLLPAFNTSTGIPFARVGKARRTSAFYSVLTAVNSIRSICVMELQPRRPMKPVSTLHLKKTPLPHIRVCYYRYRRSRISVTGVYDVISSDGGPTVRTSGAKGVFRYLESQD